jgi:hypothetical protein
VILDEKKTGIDEQITSLDEVRTGMDERKSDFDSCIYEYLISRLTSPKCASESEGRSARAASIRSVHEKKTGHSRLGLLMKYWSDEKKTDC